MKTLMSIGLALISVGAFTGTSQAAQTCGPRDKIVETLAQRFQENRQALGLAAGAQNVVELFVSSKGTWTLSLTDTRGITCIVGTGEGWHDSPKLVAGLES